jgi:hypothetical protein
MMNGPATNMKQDNATNTRAAARRTFPAANKLAAKKTNASGNIAAFAKYPTPSTTPSSANVAQLPAPLPIRSKMPAAKYTHAATHMSGVTREIVINSSEDQMNKL